MLRFDCDVSEMSEEENKKTTLPSLIFLGELPVSEKWTIRQLKGKTIIIFPISLAIEPTLKFLVCLHNNHNCYHILFNSTNFTRRTFVTTMEYFRIGFHWNRSSTTPTNIPSSYTCT